MSVEELLEACAKNGTAISIEQLQAIVADNDKQRFAFSDDGKRIRASQGHSVEVDLGYKSSVPPGTLFHGSAEQFVSGIKKGGLVKGKRHDVHLSLSVETATSVGRRHGKVVMLQIDSGAMHRDGYKFRVSANGVWLTEQVPVGYIKFLP